MLRTVVCVGVGLLLAAGGVAAQDKAQNQDKEMKGKIVRIDADKGVVVIKTAENKEMEYRADKLTKFYGTDKKTLADGLRFKDFKEGTDVWYRLGTGVNDRNLMELRLGPSIAPPAKD